MTGPYFLPLIICNLQIACDDKPHDPQYDVEQEQSRFCCWGCGVVGTSSTTLPSFPPLFQVAFVAVIAVSVGREKGAVLCPVVYSNGVQLSSLSCMTRSTARGRYHNQSNDFGQEKYGVACGWRILKSFLDRHFVRSLKRMRRCSARLFHLRRWPIQCR